MSGSSRTVVVGGGIAGICAALRLVEHGVRPILLEKDPDALGGRVRRQPDTGFTYAGREEIFTVEHGIHAWWRPYRNFLALIERYGLSDQLIDAWDQAVLYDDGQQVHHTNFGRDVQRSPLPEPIHPALMLRKRNIRRMITRRDLARFPTLIARIAEVVRFDPTSPEARSRYDERSAADFIRGTPVFAQAFLQCLCRDHFFSEPGQVSLWAFLAAMQLYVFLRREDGCFAFARGPAMDAVVQPLIDRVVEGGGELRLGMEVERVQRDPAGGWHLHVRPAGGRPRVLRAAELVLAVDVRAAQALRAVSPDLADVYGDLDRFQGRASSVVRLWWSRAPTEAWGESGVFSGRGFSDVYFWLHRFQDEFAEWHRRTGGSVCELQIYSPQRKHALPDEEILERAERDVARAFPELKGSRVHRTLVRNPATHINFAVGTVAHAPRVRTLHRDLVLCGDWIDAGHATLYMERACQTGLDAANALLEARGRRPAPILPPASPRWHVSALQRALRRWAPAGD